MLYVIQILAEVTIAFEGLTSFCIKGFFSLGALTFSYIKPTCKETSTQVYRVIYFRLSEVYLTLLTLMTT
jgi:hypothetical protein